MQHKLPKGTFDILPYNTHEEWQLAHIWQYIEEKIRNTSSDYGYKEIRTPIYEMTALFDRGVGETSDIVSKEMFSFEDKGGRNISLRPEGTSAVMRSFIEHKLYNVGAVHKFFYIGPMFRYERPQSGRYRQHHQFGIEAIGNPDPEQDAEVIDFLCQFYKILGIKNYAIHINTVGDLESRTNFKNALLAYLKPHIASMSKDSQTRFEKNPLRILDSKDPGDKEIVKDAPSILDFLTPSASKHFEKLCSILKSIKIPYLIDDKIVRGLDYYSSTVFEAIAKDLGAQNTIGGGGRFDGLISSFGGPNVPAVGWAMGLERVIQVLIAQNVSFPKAKGPLVYFIPMGEEAKDLCFTLCSECRHQNIPADIELHAKKMQPAIQNALKSNAKYCAIIGSDEMKKGTIQLKDLHSREQLEIKQNEIFAKLQEVSYA